VPFLLSDTMTYIILFHHKDMKLILINNKLEELFLYIVYGYTKDTNKGHG